MTDATLANLRRYRLTATQLHNDMWCIHAGNRVIARGFRVSALNHFMDGYAAAMATMPSI